MQNKWLETLLELSNQADEDVREVTLSDKPLIMPLSVTKLIAFTQSVEVIIKVKHESN